MKSRYILTILLALALVLGLPSSTATVEAQTGVGYLRVLHASPDSPAVDIYVGNGETPLAAGVTFGQSTALIEFAPGTYMLDVRPAGDVTGTSLLRTRVLVRRGEAAEAVVMGKPAVAGREALRLGLYPVRLDSPNGKARVYIIHTVLGAPAVDVASGAARLVRNLGYSEGTLNPVEVDPGAYNLRLTPVGQIETTLYSFTADLAANKVYTIVAVGPPDNLTTITLAGQPWPQAGALAGQTGFIRVTHASEDAGAVDIYLDGARTPAVGNLEFGSSTDFLELPAKEYTVQIRAAGTSSRAAPAYETAFTLEKGQSVEVVALGQLAGDIPFEVKVFPIDRTATAGKARVYAVHAAMGAGGVDVKVNGKLAIAGFAPGTYTETPFVLDPGIVNVTGTLAGTASPVRLRLVQAEITGDTIYTLIAVPSARSPLADSPLVLTSASISDAAAGKTGLVRVTHAAFGAPAVDIRVNDGLATYSAVEFGQSTEWATLPATTYTVNIRPAGASVVNLPIYTGTFSVPAGKGLEVVAMGTPGVNFEVRAYTVDVGSAKGLARVYILHAAPDGGKIDLRLNGGVLGRNFAYGSITSLAIPPGLYNIVGTAAGKSAPVLLRAVQTQLEADTIYLLIAVPGEDTPLIDHPLVLVTPAQ